MNYFNFLDLSREPFSNSPEPDFFYGSRQHVECLQKLELAIRLRRGLNTVIGDVGAGKTTICRQIIQKFADDNEIETYLILDPAFDSPIEFLRAFTKILGIADKNENDTEWQLKEKIKNHLFDKGVDEGKTLVLIIDEGQNISESCIEVLRELLNYETNEYKLLQIIIFAQREFYGLLKSHAALADRVNFSYDLHSMSFSDTREMIRFRLERAKEKKDGKDVSFTFLALCVIYLATGGYPRKIVGLCHRIIMALVIKERLKAGLPLALSCARVGKFHGRLWKMGLAAAVVLALLTFIGFEYGPDLFFGHVPKQAKTIAALQPPDSIVISIKAPDPESEPVSAATAHSDAENQSTDITAEIPPQPETTEATEMVQSAQTTPEIEMSAISPAQEEPAKPAEETQPEQKPQVAAAPPESLGWLVVRRNVTICRVIRGIYGDECTRDRIISIHKANPHIQNPDRIEPGGMLKLPAVESGFSPRKGKRYWVIIARRDNLEDAFALYIKNAGQVPLIQVFPNWNGIDGLRFDVIVKKSFAEETAAKSAIEALPPSLSSEAIVVNGWSKDTVFFSMAKDR